MVGTTNKSMAAMCGINRHDDEAVEFDGEGVAYADGAFYVIGSHGHPRKAREPDKVKAKITASSQVVRVRLKSTVGQPLSANDVRDIQRSSKLRDIIAAEPSLKRFIDRRLDDNGLTIERIAVVGNRLFAGFRGPTLDNGRIPVLSVSLAALFESGARDPKLFLLPLGKGRGVRDLAVFGDGLLILAGPTGDEAGPYSVYWWNASSENVRYLADITKASGADDDRKPEALLPLDRGSSGLRVLVFFDGEKEGAPRVVVIPAP